MFNRLRARRAGLAYGSAAAAVLIGGSLLGAAPAQAAPERPYGTVVAKKGVNERQFPSRDSSVRGTLPHKAQVGLKCKVRAENIGGNTVWYLLRSKNVWVSAKYVDNTGYVDYCKNVMRSKLTAGKQAREARG